MQEGNAIYLPGCRITLAESPLLYHLLTYIVKELSILEAQPSWHCFVYVHLPGLSGLVVRFLKCVNFSVNKMNSSSKYVAICTNEFYYFANVYRLTWTLILKDADVSTILLLHLVTDMT